MIHSDELGELATALAAFQAEAETVSKTASNPFFKSSYAPLPEVVKAASPLLTKHGLSVVQTPGVSELGKDTLTTMLLHSSGQFIADTMELHPVKNDPQAQGSAITYGRRYSYMAITGLVADEDDDGNAGSTPAPRQQRKAATPKPKPAAAPKPVVSPDRLASLQALASGARGKTVADALKDLNVTLGKTLPETLATLTPEQADKFEAAISGGLLPANPEPLDG